MAKLFSMKKTVLDIQEKVDKIAKQENRLEKQQQPVFIQGMQRETWVKVGIIQKLTNWDKYDLRQARLTNLVVSKKEDGKISYLLESLHPMFIEK